jgi:acetyl-CoA carboxylase beta subunit
MTGYSVVKIDAPGAVAKCERCRFPMFKGEMRYWWQGMWVCPECLEEAIHRMNASDLASTFDIDAEEVE